MKTPWRFVGDLLSRRPKADSKGTAAAPAPVALEYKPANQQANPDVETAAADPVAATQVEETSTTSLPEPEPAPAVIETAPPIEDDVPDVSVAFAEPAERPTSPLVEEAVPPAAQTTPVNTEAAETPVKAMSARRKKVEAIAERATSIAPAGAVAPSDAAGPRSFTDEMADLDAEVDALRRQLAEKLTAQNAQLRKMLAKFDRR